MLFRSVDNINVQDDDTFEYNADYGVLLCKLHHTAIRGFDYHLRKVHNLGIERRRPLLKKYGEFILHDPKNIPLPKSGGPPFEALGEPMTGFQCDDCDTIVVSKNSI